MKDVMCLHEFGFNALAPNSENIIITKAQYNRLDVRFTNKFCLFDNDLAGVKGAKKYKREFGIKCIFIKRKYAKDMSDLYKAISNTQFWIVVDELKDIISGKVNNTKHFYVF